MPVHVQQRLAQQILRIAPAAQALDQHRAADRNDIFVAEAIGLIGRESSGAEQDRPGLVRSADNGTLFLDEIADLPLPSQAALLRVLQEREVTPVGATQPIPVDVRIGPPPPRRR